MPSLRGGTGAGRGADRSRDGLGGTTSTYAFRELRLTLRRSTHAGERGLEHWRSTRVRERRLGALRLGENEGDRWPLRAGRLPPRPRGSEGERRPLRAERLLPRPRRPPASFAASSSRPAALTSRESLSDIVDRLRGTARPSHRTLREPRAAEPDSFGCKFASCAYRRMHCMHTLCNNTVSGATTNAHFIGNACMHSCIHGGRQAGRHMPVSRGFRRRHLHALSAMFRYSCHNVSRIRGIESYVNT